MSRRAVSTISGAAFMLAATGIAFAADMTVKAPPPAPAFSWTGVYAGIALGGKWGDTNWTTTSIAVPGIPSVVDSSSPRNFDPSAFRYGGYAGYNWQFAPQWLLGVEADFAGADGSSTSTGIPGCAIGCIGLAAGPGLDTSSVKMRWDASVRARMGYLISADLLAYATGGIAWQNVQASATCQHSLPDPLCLFLPGTPFATATSNTILTGWTIGGGLEYRIYGNWLLRGEYRYSDFGTRAGDVLDLGLPGALPTVVTHNLRVHTHIATGGIGFKF